VRSAFWKKFETYREQPTVHATHDYLLLMQGTSSNGARPLTVFWSTIPEMNNLVPNSQLRAPLASLVYNMSQLLGVGFLLSVTGCGHFFAQFDERDLNLDMKPEMINMQISMPINSDEAITSIRFLAFMAVNITVPISFHPWLFLFIFGSFHKYSHVYV
jgi:hypothetical protein